jgi:HK97 family phage portal protein
VTVLQRFFAASLESPTTPISGSSIVSYIGGSSTSSGKSVTEEGALAMSAVFRAVNLIAGTSASLPLHAYRAADKDRIRLTSGRAAELLAKPHPDMTPFELWETVYGHLLLWGNAYVRVLRNELGQIKELWPIHPGRVRAGRTSEAGRKVYLIDGDEDHPYFDRDIMHIPAFGYDGVCGVSPIRLARHGIGLALAAEEFGAKLFGSGSLATGVLQTEQRLTPDQADALQSRWRAKRAGMSSAHETIVLDKGATFHQLTIPPEDAQFLQTRSFQVAEVARWYGVPPHMLMETDKSTSWGTGIEQQSIGFVVYTLRTWLIRVEQRLTMLLDPRAVYAKYTVEGLLRGDSAQRAEFYRVMQEVAGASANEIRALEEWSPIENGDEHFRPLNLGTLGEPDPAAVPEPATSGA